MALDEISDSELDLGSMLNCEKTITADEKSFALISEEEAVIIKTSCDPDRSPDKTAEDEMGNSPYPFLNGYVLGKPVEDENEVVDEGELNRRVKETSTPAKKQKIFNNEDYEFRRKFKLRFWLIFLFSQLVPQVLSSDCNYNCIVTHEKNKNGFKFEISCQSEWKDLKFVSLCRHSSTHIVVVSYKEGRELEYGPLYEHRASINVENRKAYLTITKITPEDTRCKYVAWVGNSTCRDKITSTTQIPENRNVTDPPPVLQDEPLPVLAWSIVLLVVSLCGLSIILVISYWKKIG